MQIEYVTQSWRCDPGKSGQNKNSSLHERQPYIAIPNVVAVERNYN